MSEGHGIMSGNRHYTTAHLVFAFTAEIQALKSPGGVPLLWSSIFVTLVAKKYHESVTLPSGLRMVYDNH